MWVAIGVHYDNGGRTYVNHIPRQSLGITTSLTDDDWLRWWNVHGVFYCTREGLEIMEPKRYGKIIAPGTAPLESLY
jgi:NAD(P)-dependent dehydrogenase (short-subunit alcohol dehydrogenase family)